jgi:hypothetical protein
MTCFINFNRINIGRIERKNSFNTHTVRYFTYSEGCSMSCSLFLNYITFERLDSFFVTFNNFIINGNIITGFKSRKFFLESFAHVQRL